MALLGERIKIADRILLPARLALNECSRRGIWIDGGEVEAARVKFEKERESARLRCQKHVGSDTFNPGSNQQVATHLIARGYDLPTTPTGEWATDKGILQELMDPLADDVIAYREAVKTISTYVTPYAAAAASPDHRMHNEYTIIRTVTGRTSARKSNVQNLDRELRSFFSAPPGEALVIADYASIEFRLAAWCAQEPTILQKYADNPNWDPHRYFASLFYDKPEEQVEMFGPNSERQIAKSANFSQLFLGTHETLVEYGAKMGVKITPNTARAAHLFFRHNAFPGFKAWWQSVLDELREKSYVESATGRRRHFGDWGLLNGHRRAEALREAVNFKVQSLAADIALLGLSACHKAGLPINGFFHDAISLHVAGEVDNLHEQLRYCMVGEPLRVLAQEFGVELNVPIEIEIKTATTNKREEREKVNA